MLSTNSFPHSFPNLRSSQCLRTANNGACRSNAIYYSSISTIQTILFPKPLNNLIPLMMNLIFFQSLKPKPHNHYFAHEHFHWSIQSQNWDHILTNISKWTLPSMHTIPKLRPHINQYFQMNTSIEPHNLREKKKVKP